MLYRCGHCRETFNFGWLPELPLFVMTYWLVVGVGYGAVLDLFLSIAVAALAMLFLPKDAVEVVTLVFFLGALLPLIALCGRWGLAIPCKVQD